jgi:hypothetical protein
LRRNQRQTCNNGSAGEYVRIDRKNGRGHGATRRQSDNENALAVDVMVQDRSLDHLADRQSLALIAPDVGRQKPSEAVVGVVGPSLLRKDHHEAMGVRQ